MKKISICIVGLFLTFRLLGKIPFNSEIYWLANSIPDIAFNNVINSSVKLFKLSDFKGKLVILDFYGTWCGSCQPGIPKLDSLQKVLKDKLQVIVICHDPDNATVEKAIATRWKGRNIALPFVLTNKQLNELFPHKMVPHEVWISPEGKLMTTTDAEEVTYDNITKALEGYSVQLKMKVDQMDFDRNKPLYVDGNGGDLSTMRFRSVFGNHIDGIISGAGENIDSVNGLKRIYFLNAPITELYQSGVHLQYLNRMVLELRDSSKLIPNKTNKVKWYQNNTYCYEITYPVSYSEERVRDKWLSDLNFSLNLYGRIEKRTVKCWALVRTLPSDISMFSKGKELLFTERLDAHGDKVYVFQNKPVQFLNYMLNGDTPPIIVDETGIKGNIDIEFPAAHLHAISALQKDLQKHGLDLIPVVREVEMLVISDAKE